jgi:pectate lyase
MQINKEMKKSTLKLNLIIAILSVVSVAGAQEYCMTSPVGYGRNATGGVGGTVKTVKTVAELRTALTTSGAAIIIVTENITFGEGQMISGAVQNKTLLGLNGVRLISTAQVANGGILKLNSNSNNVIIRNLIFEGPGAYDVDGNDLLSNTGCTNLWVDHCEFYDGVDGNFDNTNSSDNITISWCKFGYNKPPKAGGSGGSSDHRFSNLVSSGATDAPSDGRRSITFQYCYWTSGCKQRMPRARNAELHLLNCFNDSPDASPVLGLGGGSRGLDCLVEGSVFENIKSMYSSYDSSDGGQHTLVYRNCTSSRTMTDVRASNQPSGFPGYTCAVLPKEELKAAITGQCGSGATLNVTAAGVVSSPCGSSVPDPLGIPQNVNASATSSSVTVTWSAVANATGYKVIISGGQQTTGGERSWSFSDNVFTAGDIATVQTVNGLTIGPNTSIGTSAQSIDGYNFTQCLKLNGGGNTSNRFVSFSVGGNATITVYAMSSGTTTRTLNFSDGTDIFDTFDVTGSLARKTVTYSGSAATLYLYSQGSGINLYAVEVEEAGGGTGGNYISEEFTVAGGNITSHTFNGLSPDTEYTCQVKTLKDSEESAYSAAKTIHTSQTTSINTAVSGELQIRQTANSLTIIGADVAALAVYSISGSLLQQQPSSQTVDINLLNKGIYFLNIRTASGIVINYKFVK